MNAPKNVPVSSIDPKRLEEFEGATLLKGSHDGLKRGGCMMEWVGYLAGEPWSDAPKCVSLVIRRFCIGLNDRWTDEERQLLKPRALRVIGTSAPIEVERRRTFMLVDWAARVIAPLALRARGFEANAAELQALHPITAAKYAHLALAPLRQAAAAAAAAAATAAAAAAATDAAADAATAAAADAADAATDADGGRRRVVELSLEMLDRLIDTHKAEPAEETDKRGHA